MAEVTTYRGTEGDSQDKLDALNSEFWNTLCGSGLARELGITDSSPQSLRKFDQWYFAFYPYLTEYIPFEEMHGQRVLEVGLGYGTVSQRIVESGADYTGLDIAQDPVDIVNYRLRVADSPGRAHRGSVLASPFADSTFDFIVAIGCYHHTGNMQRALDESYRMLRPSGALVGMVYNAYSYRRWFNAPCQTARYLGWDWFKLGTQPLVSPDERAAYDTDLEGTEAPHTDFVSRHHLRRMCRRFGTFNATLANIEQERPFQGRARDRLLQTAWPKRCGLDVYFSARR